MILVSLAEPTSGERMRFERRRRTRDDERVLPLVNIVFLLLIFFMLTGRLSVPDPFGVAPPHSASRSAADGHGTTITVLMAANGRLALDGKVVERARLKSDVAKRLSDDGTTRVRLMADGRAEARRVVAVIDLLQRSGVKNLHLRTVSRNR